MKGEKIYEYDLDVKEVRDFCVPMEDILSGETSIPPQGARVDFAFEGRSSGPSGQSIQPTEICRVSGRFAIGKSMAN